MAHRPTSKKSEFNIAVIGPSDRTKSAFKQNFEKSCQQALQITFPDLNFSCTKIQSYHQNCERLHPIKKNNRTTYTGLNHKADIKFYENAKNKASKKIRDADLIVLCVDETQLQYFSESAFNLNENSFNRSLNRSFVYLGLMNSFLCAQSSEDDSSEKEKRVLLLAKNDLSDFHNSDAYEKLFTDFSSYLEKQENGMNALVLLKFKNHVDENKIEPNFIKIIKIIEESLTALERHDAKQPDSSSSQKSNRYGMPLKKLVSPVSENTGNTGFARRDEQPHPKERCSSQLDIVPKQPFSVANSSSWIRQAAPDSSSHESSNQFDISRLLEQTVPDSSSHESSNQFDISRLLEQTVPDSSSSESSIRFNLPLAKFPPFKPLTGLTQREAAPDSSSVQSSNRSTVPSAEPVLSSSARMFRMTDRGDSKQKVEQKRILPIKSKPRATLAKKILKEIVNPHMSGRSIFSEVYGFFFGKPKTWVQLDKLKKICDESISRSESDDAYLRKLIIQQLLQIIECADGGLKTQVVNFLGTECHEMGEGASDQDKIRSIKDILEKENLLLDKARAQLGIV